MQCCSSTTRRWVRSNNPSRSVASQQQTFCSSPTIASHIGARTIPYPATVAFDPQYSSPTQSLSSLRISGPKGQLSINIHPFVKIAHLPTSAPPALSSIVPIQVSVLDPTIKHQRAIWGLTRSLIANAVEGVSTGYELSLRLVGVGYRATLEDIGQQTPGRLDDTALVSSTQRLNLKLGFAHPVLVNLPPDVRATVPNSTTIVLSGTDKQRLGEVAARVRAWRAPEPYNVRGITPEMLVSLITNTLLPINYMNSIRGREFS